MIYEEFEPAPELAGIVNTYWAFTLPPDARMPYDHRVVPDGMVSFTYIRSRYFQRAVFVGPRLEALNPPVRPGDRFWGIRFQPGVFKALFGFSPVVIRDKVEEAREFSPTFADAVFGELQQLETAEEAAQLFDLAIARQIEPGICLDPPMLDAIRGLIDSFGQVGIRETAAASGLSERQFRRRFIDLVGLTPKEFATIRRLRRSATRLVEENSGWADIAAESGYADQAHLTHDYTRIMGISPTTLAERLRRITHGAIHS